MGVLCLVLVVYAVFIALRCVHSSFAIISIGRRELVSLLGLSSWCLVTDMWLFLKMTRVYLQFVIVVLPDPTHLLILVLYSFSIILLRNRGLFASY